MVVVSVVCVVLWVLNCTAETFFCARRHPAHPWPVLNLRRFIEIAGSYFGRERRDKTLACIYSPRTEYIIHHTCVLSIITQYGLMINTVLVDTHLNAYHLFLFQQPLLKGNWWGGTTKTKTIMHQVTVRI